jgi:methionyl-tRNA formyltransferase
MKAFFGFYNVFTYFNDKRFIIFDACESNTDKHLTRYKCGEIVEMNNLEITVKCRNSFLKLTK